MRSAVGVVGPLAASTTYLHDIFCATGSAQTRSLAKVQNAPYVHATSTSTMAIRDQNVRNVKNSLIEAA